MADYKVVLGLGAIAIGFVAYIPYFINIFGRRTKPHVFSWFVWGLLEGIAFFAQLSKGAGAGAWATGFTAMMCFVIAAAAIFRGEKQITNPDWWSFFGALLGLVLWQMTDSPLLAIILVSLVDALAFVPTFRKSFFKPYEETATTYSLGIFKAAISLVALEAFNTTTWLYPASLVLTNTLFVTMLLVRRRKISRETVIYSRS